MFFFSPVSSTRPGISAWSLNFSVLAGSSLPLAPNFRPNVSILFYDDLSNLYYVGLKMKVWRLCFATVEPVYFSSFSSWFPIMYFGRLSALSELRFTTGICLQWIRPFLSYNHCIRGNLKSRWKPPKHSRLFGLVLTYYILISVMVAFSQPRAQFEEETTSEQLWSMCATAFVSMLIHPSNSSWVDTTTDK